MSEQKSQEWLQIRVGKFTGSEIHKLMKSGRTKDKVFSDTAISYIYDKIAEIMTNGLSIQYKKFDSKATEWGNDQEPNAKKCYSDFTGNQIFETEFHQFSEYFGASPDGFIGNEGLLEVKCPYNTINHVRHLLCRTAKDLWDVSEEYYWQIQAELLATGRKWCDFVSYDPRCTERTCLKIIRIDRDEEIMNQLKDRIELATDYMMQIIEKINEIRWEKSK